MTSNTNKLIVTLFSLLIFSTYVLSVFFFQPIGWYYEMSYWLYYLVIAALAIIGNVILYKYKQSNSSLNISIIFIILTVFSIITAPFKDFWLGAFTGTTTQLPNGTFFFILAPLIIRIVDYLKLNNKNSLEIIVAIFVILRGAVEVSISGTISNTDFLGLTGLFAIVIIAPSIDIKNWLNQSELIKIIGVLSAITMVIFSENKSSIFSLTAAPISVYIFYLIIKKLFSKDFATKLNIIIPVSIITIGTLSMIVLKANDLVEPNTTLDTIWKRAVMIESALAAMDYKTFIIGNGWGLNNLFILNDVWADGVSNTKNNIFKPNVHYQTIGIGINHIHNEFFEYFTGGGIIALLLYLSLWVLLGYYARHSILKIATLSAVAMLYTTWFIHTADTVLLITMFAVIAVGYKSTNQPSKKLQNINKRFSIIANFVIIFIAVSYLPYMYTLKTDVPKSINENIWYGPNNTGMRTEQRLWRAEFLKTINKLVNNKEVSRNELIYMVNILTTLRKLAIEGNNKNAIFDLPLYYFTLFADRTSNVKLEDFRRQQFQYWEESIFLATDVYTNRFDLSYLYLKWHFERNLNETVDKLTKKLLKQNPNNPVALYWRGLLLIQQNDNSGYDMIEKSFKQNITRYQPVAAKFYQKHKHLLNPKYK